jgi:hypothetical protein
MAKQEQLVKRDKIAGYFIAPDIEDGEYSATDLSSRLAARQQQMNKAVQADWEEAGETSTSKTLAPARRQLKNSIAETSEPA